MALAPELPASQERQRAWRQGLRALPQLVSAELREQVFRLQVLWRRGQPCLERASFPIEPSRRE